jgi:hypothetical protein
MTCYRTNPKVYKANISHPACSVGMLSAILPVAGSREAEAPRMDMSRSNLLPTSVSPYLQWVWLIGFNVEKVEADANDWWYTGCCPHICRLRGDLPWTVRAGCLAPTRGTS